MQFRILLPATLALASAVLAVAFVVVGTRPAAGACEPTHTAVPHAGTVSQIEMQAPRAVNSLEQPALADLPDAGSAQRAAVELRYERQARTWPDDIGRLLLRAVDADSGESLHEVRVRASSVTRVADVTIARRDGCVDLRLTPDVYSVVVMSRGYEPLEWAAVEAFPESDSALRTAELLPGTGRIEGRVVGSASDLRSFRVELIGDGIRPCSRCLEGVAEASGVDPAQASAWERESPCPACGFAGISAIQALGADGRFGFDRLASGNYTLCFRDRQWMRACDLQVIALRESETLRVEVQAPVRRDVLMEIVDVDGLPLAQEWSRRIRAAGGVERRPDPPGPFVTAFDWEATFVDDSRRLGRAWFTSPGPIPGIPVRDSNIVCGGDDETALTRVDDRERAEAEFVLPSIPFPALEGTKILCAVESSGLVRFRDLPAREIHLELAGGGFTSRVVIPPSDSEVRVEARLVRAEEDAEKVPPVARPWTFREHEAERSR